MNTCRFCGTFSSSLTHYGGRAYACPACLVLHKGAAGVAKLHNWQIISTPRFVEIFVKAYGAGCLERFTLDELEAMPYLPIMRAGLADEFALLLERKRAARGEARA